MKTYRNMHKDRKSSLVYNGNFCHYSIVLAFAASDIFSVKAAPAEAAYYTGQKIVNNVTLAHRTSSEAVFSKTYTLMASIRFLSQRHANIVYNLD